jgi:hypothetical protein
MSGAQPSWFKRKSSAWVGEGWRGRKHFPADDKKPAEAGSFLLSKPFQHPVGSLQAMVDRP